MVLCETGKKKNLLGLISPKLIWEMEGYSWLWIVIIHTRMYLSHIQDSPPLEKHDTRRQNPWFQIY